MRYLCVLLFLCAVLSGSVHAECLGHGGKVSWWFIYKLPAGDTYLYFDEKSTQFTTYQSLSDTKSPLLTTIKKICPQNFDSKNRWLSYNDQIGTCKDNTGELDEERDKTTNKPIKSGIRTNGNRAHSKGILSEVGEGTTWILHSQPALLCANQQDRKSTKHLYNLVFPQRGTSANSPAQHFMCANFPDKIFNEILKLLVVEQVQVDRSSFLPKYVIDRAFLTTQPALICSHKLLIESPKSTFQAIAYAKYGHYNKNDKKKQNNIQVDLWAQIYPEIKDAWKLNKPLLINTWRTSGNPLIIRADTQVSIVFARSTSGLDDKNKKKLYWLSTSDHSKWGISDSTEEIAVFCVTGSNREDTQANRGGEAVCFTNKDRNNKMGFAKLADELRKLTVFSYIYDQKTDKPRPAAVAGYKFPEKGYEYTSTKVYWAGPSDDSWDVSKFLGTHIGHLNEIKMTPAMCNSAIQKMRKTKNVSNTTMYDEIDMELSHGKRMESSSKKESGRTIFGSIGNIPSRQQPTSKVQRSNSVNSNSPASHTPLPSFPKAEETIKSRGRSNTIDNYPQSSTPKKGKETPEADEQNQKSINSRLDLEAGDLDAPDLLTEEQVKEYCGADWTEYPSDCLGFSMFDKMYIATEDTLVDV